MAKAINGEASGFGPVNNLSDGLGIPHIFKAAKLMGSAASLFQEGELVTFEACLETEVSELEDPEAPSGAEASSSSSLELPFGLLFCYLDDSNVARTVVTMNIKSRIPGSKVETFGKDEADVGAFLDAVLQRANVAILDQNLQYAEKTYLGTDLAKKLLAGGFTGLLCIRSADCSDDEVEWYAQNGAHCAIDKASGPDVMVHQLMRAYAAHTATETAEPGRQSSSRYALRGPGHRRHLAMQVLPSSPFVSSQGPCATRGR